MVLSRLEKRRSDQRGGWRHFYGAATARLSLAPPAMNHRGTETRRFNSELRKSGMKRPRPSASGFPGFPIQPLRLGALAVEMAGFGESLALPEAR